MKIEQLIGILAFFLFGFSGSSQPLNHGWTGVFKSNGWNYAHGVAVGNDGSVYATGTQFGWTDMDPGVTTEMMYNSSSQPDCNITKLDANGKFEWNAVVSGAGYDTGLGIITDEDGNVYTLGSFKGTVDFDPGPDEFNLVTASPFTAEYFILKLTPDKDFVWAINLGEAVCWDIELDSQANVYVAGYFQTINDFDPGTGTFYMSPTGDTPDAHITKLDSSGAFIWAKQFEAEWDCQIQALHVQPNGNCTVSGWFKGITDFDPGPDVYSLPAPSGPEHAFVVALDDLGDFIWATKYDCDEGTRATTVCKDNMDFTYSAGWFNDTTDFESGGDIVELIPVTDSDLFLCKHGPNGDLIWVKQFAGSDLVPNAFMTINSEADLFITGIFRGTVDFDPGVGVANLTSLGAQDDIYLLKLDSSGAYNWAYHYGNYSDNHSTDIKLDSLGNLYWTGHFGATIDFDHGPGLYELSSSSSYNVFVGRFGQCSGATESSFMSVSACDSIASPTCTAYYTSTGIYSDTLLTVNGCDSVVTVDFTALSTSSTLIETECDSFVSPSGSYTWSVSGTYVDTIANVAGCDSVITIELTIPDTDTTIATFECDSLTSPSGLYVWASSGTFLDTIPSSFGCDSVITFDLTIGSSANAYSQTVCDSLVSPSGEVTWMISGIYNDTIPNSLGCDSVLTVNLTVNSAAYSSSSIAVCDSMVSPSGLYTWSSTGVYADTLLSSLGCDSIISIDLTVGQTNDTSIVETSCFEYLSPSETVTWITSGVYYDTLVNSSGCDSIIEIDLTILDVDTSITVSGLTLSSGADGDTYQWIDCETGLSLIGETGNSLDVESNGSYAVVVTTSGCSDTSSCVEINFIGMDEFNTISIHPNPSDGVFKVEVSDILVYEIFDFKGAVILSGMFEPTKNQIDLSSYDSGLYILKVGDNRIRLVKY